MYVMLVFIYTGKETREGGENCIHVCACVRACARPRTHACVHASPHPSMDAITRARACACTRAHERDSHFANPPHRASVFRRVSTR